MTFFEVIPSLDERAMSHPRMMDMLNALARNHINLRRHVTTDALWRQIADPDAGKSTHAAVAHAAGYIEASQIGATNLQKLCLTDKGWQMIGQAKPFWM